MAPWSNIFRVFHPILWFPDEMGQEELGRALEALGNLCDNRGPYDRKRNLESCSPP